MRRSGKPAKDLADITNSVEQLNRADYPCGLFIFPEGTFATPECLLRSQQYAEKQNRPCLKRTLLPRTAGLYTMLKTAAPKKFKVVYDVTMVYEGVGAECVSRKITSLDLIDGVYPVCHIHLERIDLAAIPLDSDEAFQSWLDGRFVQKDAIKSDFYEADASGKQPLGLVISGKQVDARVVDHSVPRRDYLIVLFFSVAQVYLARSLLSLVF